MTEQPHRRIPPWLWALGGVVGAILIVFVLVVGPWLLTRYPQRGLTSEQALKAKNDVRTTLVQALAGLAVAGGLAVTYSTYRQNQRDQADRREEQDRLYQLSQAEQAARREEQDRTYQLKLAAHVNELYTRAVEQLGHDQAPVRLGALYSLVHLAQANPQQRQTVVDVLCAYLRMPYPPSDAAAAGSKRDPAQELQVRLTAQQLLARHLRPMVEVSGQDAQNTAPSPDDPFWPRMMLDLTGATLVDFNLQDASVSWADFSRVTFTGFASFFQATFTGRASFDGATFDGAMAAFYGATFTHDASFNKATFKGNAWFSQATFIYDASFKQATFSDRASFINATFTGYVSFKDARVLHLQGDSHGDAIRRDWPDGWTVRPDRDDPTRGTLVSSPKGVGV